MKNLTSALAILLFILPSEASAAALTPQQSSSLIAVVQSSPNTPASAFVSLITAFSNITVNQATSLITVVQAAPSVPATAFVDLLTSFTVDTIATQPITPAVTPVATPQPAPITPTPATVTPMDKSDIIITVSKVLGDQVYTDSSGLGGTSYHRRQWKVSVLDKEGKPVFGASVTVNKPIWSLPQNEGQTTQTANSQSGPTNTADWNTIFTLAEEVTSATFTSNGLTKTFTVE